MKTPRSTSTLFPFEREQALNVSVSCAGGLESLLATELLDLLGEVELEVVNACVNLQCDLQSCYRICLWSRLAEQVLVNLAEIRIEESDQDLARAYFYKKVKGIAWESVFPASHSFHIDSSGGQSIFTDSRFATLVMKDALVDRFREKQGERPNVSRDAPVKLNLFMDEKVFLVQLNLAGERLHRRGYRQNNVEAPLRETLAAALLRALDWHQEGRDMDYFLDPCCGSGTLLAEALMMSADMAPGLMRAESNQFCFPFLLVFDSESWQEQKQQARERQQHGLQELDTSSLKFRGYDSDTEAIKTSQANLDVLGVSKHVHLERRAFAQLSPLLVEGHNSRGLIIANPPYGERLGQLEGLRYLYRFLGDRAREAFPAWRLGVISNHVELLDAMGFSEFEQNRFYNGNLKCLFRRVDIAADGADTGDKGNYFIERIAALQESSAIDKLAIDEFAIPFRNRLLKNMKYLKSWLLENAVDNFRLYDADIPEFKLAIDCYQNSERHFLVVSEYAPPKTIDATVAKQRLNLALACLRTLFGLHREDVFIKTRQRQKGKQQYEAKASKGRNLLRIRENGHYFLINPLEYLDTGLFLDHRLMRQRLYRESRGKRFLNLFCYTGSATVYALAGGAKHSCSVDLSSRYLDWAVSNVLANGYDADMHQFVKADVMDWLANNKDQYDLIFIDPPTFSNTRKKKLQFDLQKDHETLIHRAMARLDQEGVLYFSNNYRQFVLSEKLAEPYLFEEITYETASRDFERHQPHRSWRVTKRL